MKTEFSVWQFSSLVMPSRRLFIKIQYKEKQPTADTRLCPTSHRTTAIRLMEQSKQTQLKNANSNRYGVRFQASICPLALDSLPDSLPVSG